MATRYRDLRLRKKLAGMREDQWATQLAIIKFHEAKLASDGITIAQRQRHLELLDQAREKLAAAN